jgi:hypothetical protein
MTGPQGEPTAGDRFDAIGTQRAAAELAGHGKLLLCKEIHDRDRQQRDDQAGPGENRTLA